MNTLMFSYKRTLRACSEVLAGGCRYSHILDQRTVLNWGRLSSSAEWAARLANQPVKSTPAVNGVTDDTARSPSQKVFFNNKNIFINWASLVLAQW